MLYGCIFVTSVFGGLKYEHLKCLDEVWDDHKFGGLETFFAQDQMFNVPMNPTAIITLSVILSLKTAILLHIKILGMQKGGYFGFKVV